LIHGIDLSIDNLFDLFGDYNLGGFTPDFLEALAHGLTADTKLFGCLGLRHLLIVN
jgi:hypothetical protein